MNEPDKTFRLTGYYSMVVRSRCPGCGALVVHRRSSECRAWRAESSTEGKTR